MSDLAALMGIAPTTAAMFMGENQALARRAKDTEQEKMLGEILQAAEKHRAEQAMAPLKMQYQQLQNEGLSADLPGRRAESTLKELTTQQKQATYDSDVATTLSTNENTQGKHADDKRQRATSFLLEAGPMMNSVPPMMRGQAFRALIEQNKMNASSPMIQQMLAMAEKNPEQFPQMITQLADRLGAQATQMNPAARVSRENNASNNAVRVSEGALDRAQQMKIAEMNNSTKERLAAAKDQAKSLSAAILSGKVPPERAAVAAKLQADMAPAGSPEKDFWQAQAMQYEQFVYNRAAASGQGKPQLSPDGGIENRELKPALSGKPTTGQTSSGTKYQIISD